MNLKQWSLFALNTVAVINTVAAPLGQAHAQQAVNVTNANPNGQTTLASSSPVAPASNWINDPCWATNAKLSTTFASTTSGGVLVGGISGQKIHVCSLDVGVSSAANLLLIEGTGGTCAGGTSVVVWGGISTTNAFPFGANSGISKGAGVGTLFNTANATNSICVQFSTATLAVVDITYVTP